MSSKEELGKLSEETIELLKNPTLRSSKESYVMNCVYNDLYPTNKLKKKFNKDLKKSLKKQGLL